MSTSPPTSRDWKQRLRLPLLIGGPVLVLVLVAYFYLTGGRYQQTDDAYVQTARVAVSSNIRRPCGGTRGARQPAGASRRPALSTRSGAVRDRRAPGPGTARSGVAAGGIAEGGIPAVAVAHQCLEERAGIPAQRTGAATAPAAIGHRFTVRSGSRAACFRRRQRVAVGSRASGGRRARATRRRREYPTRSASGGAAGTGCARCRAARSFLCHRQRSERWRGDARGRTAGRRLRCRACTGVRARVHA